MEEKKYYHRINNLDIDLCETNHKYIMIHQWAHDNSHRWGIASFQYDESDDYYYLRTYGIFDKKKVDWYDFGCLVDLGYKWICDGALMEHHNE
jgi:hypothetical protein